MNKKYTIFPSRHSKHFNVHTVLLSLIITFIYINGIRIKNKRYSQHGFGQGRQNGGDINEIELIDPVNEDHERVILGIERKNEFRRK